VTALLLKLEGLINPRHEGPVFFREKRVSRGKTFYIYKFRTVKRDILKTLETEKESITQYTSRKNKSKYLTPVGSFLAQTYLDEFPQFFNVLKGDLSLVGPRPHIPAHYEYDLKNGVVSAKYIKAGIMGLVQASKGEPELRKAIARMAARHYTENKTLIFISRLYFQKYLKASAAEMLLYDLWIMYRCLLVVLAAKGI